MGAKYSLRKYCGDYLLLYVLSCFLFTNDFLRLIHIMNKAQGKPRIIKFIQC